MTNKYVIGLMARRFLHGVVDKTNMEMILQVPNYFTCFFSKCLGPLPRSWMKEQWNLQKQILARYRSLGIVGQLPGFQGTISTPPTALSSCSRPNGAYSYSFLGNVPWPLAAILNDKNITQEGDTGMK